MHQISALAGPESSPFKEIRSNLYLVCWCTILLDVNKPLHIWPLTHNSTSWKISKFYQPFTKLEQKICVDVFMTAIATLLVTETFDD